MAFPHTAVKEKQMQLNRVVQSLIVAAGVFGAGLALAGDPPKASAPSMDEKAMFEKIMKAGSPGEAHKALEPLSGKFDVKVKSWNDPSKPPEESAGKSERKWIMGGRYLQEDFQGTYGGQPFTGMGVMGHDNVTGKYFGSWIDSMSTSMMVSHGSMKGPSISYSGMMSDPVSGKQVKSTMSITIKGPDAHLLEMWGPGPGGKKMKMMELSYSRSK